MDEMNSKRNFSSIKLHLLGVSSKKIRIETGKMDEIKEII